MDEIQRPEAALLEGHRAWQDVFDKQDAVDAVSAAAQHQTWRQNSESIGVRRRTGEKATPAKYWGWWRMLNDLLTKWLLAALKTNVRQQVGFDGGLGSLQDPPHNQVHHTGGRTHQINHLCVAHVAHICGVHLISR